MYFDAEEHIGTEDQTATYRLFDLFRDDDLDDTYSFDPLGDSNYWEEE